MNTCPNCGKMAGLHGSILQGCMCQYSMQAQPQRTWVGLTDEEIRERWFAAEPTPDGRPASYNYARAIEAKLKEKNGY